MKHFINTISLGIVFVSVFYLLIAYSFGIIDAELSGAYEVTRQVHEELVTARVDAEKTAISLDTSVKEARSTATTALWRTFLVMGVALLTVTLASITVISISVSANVVHRHVTEIRERAPLSQLAVREYEVAIERLDGDQDKKKLEVSRKIDAYRTG